MSPQAEKAYYRFTVLFFNALLTFGSYFSSDIPSVLQDQFQGNLTCPNVTAINGTVDCVLGLGMSPEQYNMLYVILSWTNAVLMVVAGLLIDKFGNHCGAFLFSSLCVLGSAIFALGSYFKGTPYLMPLMFTGRLLFGSGNGSLSIVQNRITAFWFKGKELALAFGITLAFSRLGSVLNFYLTKQFEERYGMQWSLWGATALCFLGFLSAIILSTLDKTGMEQLNPGSFNKNQSHRMRIQDVKLLSLKYWLLVLTIMFFYNCIFGFIADASKFIQDKYLYGQKEAAYIAGAIYNCSLLLSAGAGFLIDYVGLRGVFIVVCAILTLPVFGLLAFTYVPPLISTIWLGITYSFASVSLWSSIPLVVPHATLGTAMGLAASVEMTGVGVSNLIVGKILGSESFEFRIPLWRWQRMMIFIFANTISCISTSVLLNIVDHRQDGVLNKTTKRADREKQPLTENHTILSKQKK